VNPIELAKGYFLAVNSLGSLRDQYNKLSQQIAREEKETEIAKDKLIKACGEKRNFLVSKDTMITVTREGVTFDKLCDATVERRRSQ
jgi:hypothetical protein